MSKANTFADKVTNCKTSNSKGKDRDFNDISWDLPGCWENSGVPLFFSFQILVYITLTLKCGKIFPSSKMILQDIFDGTATRRIDLRGFYYTIIPTHCCDNAAAAWRRFTRLVRLRLVLGNYKISTHSQSQCLDLDLNKFYQKGITAKYQDSKQKITVEIFIS